MPKAAYAGVLAALAVLSAPSYGRQAAPAPHATQQPLGEEECFLEPVEGAPAKEGEAQKQAEDNKPSVVKDVGSAVGGTAGQIAGATVAGPIGAAAGGVIVERVGRAVAKLVKGKKKKNKQQNGQVQEVCVPIAPVEAEATAPAPAQPEN